jgi:hypothetical protein
MIVIGLDVHKQSVTAVAIDEAGRPLEEKLIVVGSEELLAWAAALDDERLWAVEDCRQLTRWLERQLLGVGEDVVRVPPKLTVPERRAGRTRGKSDPIDALAIARGAIREPGLSRPRPDERVYLEIKLLVDHRDDLVDLRRRTQQRLRCHLFQLDPTYQLPLRMLGRHSHLERVARWLARQDQELQVRLARELVNSCRQLNRQIAELAEPVAERVARLLADAPGSRIDRLPTPLTSTNRKAARPPRHTTVAKARAPKPARVCKRCGNPTPSRSRVYCDECLPHYQREQYADAFHGTGLAAIEIAKRHGHDPSHTAEAERKRGATISERKHANTDWETRYGKLTDLGAFEREILPTIQQVPLSRLMRATGLSLRYVSQIRRGEKTPHPRHWQSLRAAAERSH